MNIFQRRKQRKQLRALIHHARAFRNMREDVLTADERAGLDAALPRNRRTAKTAKARRWRTPPWSCRNAWRS